jgi:hypothetical protein
MKRLIRRGFIAALASGAFVSLGSSVLGGVTGDVTGVVKDQTGAPVAGGEGGGPSALDDTNGDDGCRRAFRDPLPRARHLFGESVAPINLYLNAQVKI